MERVGVAKVHLKMYLLAPAAIAKCQARASRELHPPSPAQAQRAQVPGASVWRAFALVTCRRCPGVPAHPRPQVRWQLSA
jgi:hypothetical protein